MGSCVSKCATQSPAKRRPSPPRPDGGAVPRTPSISTSTSARVPLGHGRRHPSSTSSSSSCSSSSSTISASSSFCSSSCSSTSSKDGYPRDRPHPHIVVLDPGSGKRSPRTPNPSEITDRAPAVLPIASIGEPIRNFPPFKRPRSTSPALGRQKSVRSSAEQTSAVPARGRRQASPCRIAHTRHESQANPPSSTGHRSSGRDFQAAAFARYPISPSPGPGLGGGANGIRVGFPTKENKRRSSPVAAAAAGRKEKLRGSPGRWGSDRHAPRPRRRETSVHPVAEPAERGGAGAAASGENCETTHAEDVNNPLIAMDCFIFL